MAKRDYPTRKQNHADFISEGVPPVISYRSKDGTVRNLYEHKPDLREIETQVHDMMGRYLDRVMRDVIVMYDGKWEDIPDGWVLCDGKNGTPDLRDKFVSMARNQDMMNTFGGDMYHTHSATIVTGGAHDHGGATSADATGLTIADHAAHAHGLNSHTHGAGTYVGLAHTHGAGTYVGLAHTHGAGTYVGPSHTHTVTAQAITTAQMPSHTHVEQYSGGAGQPLGRSIGGSDAGFFMNITASAVMTNDMPTQATGGGGTHNHGGVTGAGGTGAVSGDSASGGGGAVSGDSASGGGGAVSGDSAAASGNTADNMAQTHVITDGGHAHTITADPGHIHGVSVTRFSHLPPFYQLAFIKRRAS